MRKTNPLTKLRFKPQVSAVFASVSILINAYLIDPDDALARGATVIMQEVPQVETDLKALSVDENGAREILVVPGIGEGDIWRCLLILKVRLEHIAFNHVVFFVGKKLE
jgi:hypothetical protein